MEVTVPEDFKGDSVELSVLAFWNVCEQICIPGEQRLNIELPVSEVPELNASATQLFATARQSLPTTDHNIKSIIAYCKLPISNRGACLMICPMFMECSFWKAIWVRELHTIFLTLRQTLI